MKRQRLFAAASIAIVCGAWGSVPARAQTWNIDVGPGGSTLLLAGNASADDFIVPGPVLAADTETAYQSNFVVPAGTFSFGNDSNANANDGLVNASAGSNFVTLDGELSNSFQVRFQSATQLKSSVEHSGVANSFTDATAVAHLSLNPGVLYRVRYDWSYNAEADTDHEGVGEDPESAIGTLSFDFGGTAVTAFTVSVNEDLGLANDSGSGSGLFFVLGGVGGSIVDLTVTVDAEAHGRFDLPGTPPGPQDLAGSFVFGEINFEATAIIPEPASWTLAATMLAALAGMSARRRCGAWGGRAGALVA
jgi:hypothetical protein